MEILSRNKLKIKSKKKQIFDFCLFDIEIAISRKVCWQVLHQSHYEDFDRLKMLIYEHIDRQLKQNILFIRR